MKIYRVVAKTSKQAGLKKGDIVKVTKEDENFVFFLKPNGHTGALPKKGKFFAHNPATEQDYLAQQHEKKLNESLFEAVKKDHELEVKEPSTPLEKISEDTSKEEFPLEELNKPVDNSLPEKFTQELEHQKKIALQQQQVPRIITVEADAYVSPYSISKYNNMATQAYVPLYPDDEIDPQIKELENQIKILHMDKEILLLKKQVRAINKQIKEYERERSKLNKKQ